MKKFLISFITITLLLSGTVFADGGEKDKDEIVSPDSELYDTTRLIEDNEYELTEDSAEKALIKNDNADKRLEEADKMLEEGDEEKAAKLIEDYNEIITTIQTNLEEAMNNQEDGVSDIEAKIIERSQVRGERLNRMLSREDLPAEAKAGMVKAYQNHMRAMERLVLKKQEREQAKENGQGKNLNNGKGQNNNGQSTPNGKPDIPDRPNKSTDQHGNSQDKEPKGKGSLDTTKGSQSKATNAKGGKGKN